MRMEELSESLRFDDVSGDLPTPYVRSRDQRQTSSYRRFVSVVSSAMLLGFLFLA